MFLPERTTDITTTIITSKRAVWGVGKAGGAVFCAISMNMNMKFIDIHCHILPGLDDGPEEMADAIAMLEQAQAAEISILVATPHFGWRGLCVTPDRISEGFGALAAEAAARGIELRAGVEVELMPGLLERVRAGQIATIGGTGKYVLVELPLDLVPEGASHAIFELASGGVIPVIAHPERNRQIQEEPNRLLELVARGALVQVNAGSLLGHFGKTSQITAEIALTHNLAHIIASDAHSAEGSRRFLLREAVASAARLVGDEQAIAMVTESPRLILLGKGVPRPEPRRYERPRRTLSSVFRKLFGGGSG